MRLHSVIHARSSLVVILALALLALSGCTPKIGDSCSQSTDCSTQGNRACDTTQLGGYCTVFGCTTNSCPDNASCVVFRVSIPGCGYNDYDAPARTARSLCMESCGQDSDCRSGYVCRDPRSSPWFAAIIDDTPHLVCIVAPTLLTDAGVDAAPSGAPYVAPYVLEGGDGGANVCTGVPLPTGEGGTAPSGPDAPDGG